MNLSWKIPTLVFHPYHLLKTTIFPKYIDPEHPCLLLCVVPACSSIKGSGRSCWPYDSTDFKKTSISTWGSLFTSSSLQISSHAPESLPWSILVLWYLKKKKNKKRSFSILIFSTDHIAERNACPCGWDGWGISFLVKQSCRDLRMHSKLLVHWRSLSWLRVMNPRFVSHCHLMPALRTCCFLCKWVKTQAGFSATFLTESSNQWFKHWGPGYR